MTETLVVRGRVRTLDPLRPEVDAVAVRDQRVVALGEGVDAIEPQHTITLDPSEVAVPGFVDEHIHLLATAAARASVDCSDAPDVCALLDRVATEAARRPADAWLRAVGYDEAFLTERRHPTAAELDRAGGGRPVVVHHRTGHAAVLSSAALARLGVDDDADGLLVDRHVTLAAVPPIDEHVLARALRRVGDDLWCAGVVAVTDATHTNDTRTLRLMDRVLGDTTPGLDVTAMVGCDRTGALRPGDRVGRVRVGPAKVMPVADGDVLAGVERGHASGFPVAVHVVEIDVLEEAIDAFGRSALPGDRIEHCALALPDQLDRVADLAVTVTTQPSFVTRRAPKYRAELSEVEQRWLYPIASLLDRGIAVRFSSDAPTVPPDPVEWVRAAVERDLAPTEAVGLDAALALASLGPLAPGGDGRLAVLRRDDLQVVGVVGGVE